MSTVPSEIRAKPGPRWSKARPADWALLPELMAGLLVSSASVKVGPPLFAKGPSNGSAGEAMPPKLD